MGHLENKPMNTALNNNLANLNPKKNALNNNQAKITANAAG